MTRGQLTGPEWEFIGSYLPIGEYGPYPERLRQQSELLATMRLPPHGAVSTAS